MESIINNVHACNYEISHFIGDNPKRAIVREALNHASHYACEYCVSKAGRSKPQQTNNDVESVTEAIRYLENMSGTSKMAQKKKNI